MQKFPYLIRQAEGGSRRRLERAMFDWDTVQSALACMQNVLGSDLKATDIEARAAPASRCVCGTARRRRRPTMPCVAGGRRAWFAATR